MLIVEYTSYFILLPSLVFSVLYNSNWKQEMIEITQWRASIGIWNHSQAALASNGLHFHLLKTTGHSNSNTTVEMGLAYLIHISLFLCFLLLLQTSGTQWTIKLCVSLYS